MNKELNSRGAVRLITLEIEVEFDDQGALAKLESGGILSAGWNHSELKKDGCSG